jgi:hypothetical protein
MIAAGVPRRLLAFMIFPNVAQMHIATLLTLLISMPE